MKARLLNKPEDYTHLGINPEGVEMWEDGRRDNDAPNHFEWWYFDAILDDGATIVIQFLNKTGRTIADKKGHPTVFFKVTMPDGTKHHKEVTFKKEDATYSTQQCDVLIGKHHIQGDLKNYTIHIDPIKDLGADLTFTNLTTPYRPGTAYIEFGDESQYYTWLCVAPRCEVCGTLLIDGHTAKVHGFGYHDHQWGSVNFHKEWNHWVWARQNYEDYSMLVFDMVSNERTDFTRFPIVFIQDATGKIVFENTNSVVCRVLEEYHDEKTSGKTYPKRLHYAFKNGEKEVEYTLSMDEIIEEKGAKNAELAKKIAFKLMHISPSYARYKATGEMIFRDGTQTITRKGSLIYEFMYPGSTYREYIERDM